MSLSHTHPTQSTISIYYAHNNNAMKNKNRKLNMETVRYDGWFGRLIGSRFLYLYSSLSSACFWMLVDWIVIKLYLYLIESIWGFGALCVNLNGIWYVILKQTVLGYIKVKFVMSYSMTVCPYDTHRIFNQFWPNLSLNWLKVNLLV